MKSFSNTRINFTKMILAVFSVSFCLHVNQLKGQVSSSNLTNTPVGLSPNFLGWDPSVNDDIRIRHLTPSQPILFGTNGVVRMRISPNVNRSVMINAPAPNNAKLRITQMRGDGAVQAELENMDGNNLNRALRVGISTPFPATNTIGVNTSCSGTSNGTDFALYAVANNARNNYGVYGESFGMGVPGNPSQGNWAGVFTDDVVVTGTTFGSDEMIKQNIQPIENARENLMQLRPVSFKFIEHAESILKTGFSLGL
jgi:hypothetical protein